MRVRAEFDRRGRGLPRADARRADAMTGQGLHRRRTKFALHHAGEARHQHVAAGSAAGEQADVVQGHSGASEAVVDRAGGHRRAGMHGSAVGIDGVVPRLDAVLREDAPLDPRRQPRQRCDVGIHAVVVDGCPGQEPAGSLDPGAFKSDRHRQPLGE